MATGPFSSVHAFSLLMSAFVCVQTYIGNVVVSVNPYEKLPLYTHSVVEEYRSRNIYELPPHM